MPVTHPTYLQEIFKSDLEREVSYKEVDVTVSGSRTVEFS